MRTILSLWLLLVPSAHAVNSINVQTFNPSVSDHFVLLEDAYRSEWPKNAKLYLGANYNYSSNPLVVLNANGVRILTAVESIQTFDLMLGFKASNRFGLFFGLPIHYVNSPLAALSGIAATSTGLGDIKILGKIRFTDDDASLSAALVPEIHLPTGNTQYFVSDASTYLGVKLALERQFTKFTLGGNIGFAAASNSMYIPNTAPLLGASAIDFRRRFMFSIGGFMPFNDKWGGNVEFNSINMLPFDKNVNPNELYAGLRHVINEEWIGTFGASMGKLGGSSGQDFRIILGVRCTMFDETNNAPVRPTYVPPVDTAIPPPRVVMKKTYIEINTPINFQENSSMLTKDGKELLDEVAGVMAKNNGAYKKILIDGHTNDKGGPKHNLWLSLERAKSVKNYLIGKGIPQTSLEARGFGQSRPKVPYSDKRAMELNRRVEFNIVQ